MMLLDRLILHCVRVNGWCAFCCWCCGILRDFVICFEVSRISDGSGEGCEVTLRDHDDESCLESVDAENEIYRAGSVTKRGGPSAGVIGA